MKKKIIVDGKWWAFEQGLLWSLSRRKFGKMKNLFNAKKEQEKIFNKRRKEIFQMSFAVKNLLLP